MALAAAVDAGNDGNTQHLTTSGQLRHKASFGLTFIKRVSGCGCGRMRVFSMRAHAMPSLRWIRCCAGWLRCFWVPVCCCVPHQLPEIQTAAEADAENALESKTSWAMTLVLVAFALVARFVDCDFAVRGQFCAARGDWATQDLRSAVIGAGVGALWWGPLLLLVAVMRYVAALRTGTQSLGETARLRTRLQQTTKTLQQRTHQLSTLHSATADLSDLRNCEHILTTAIERTLSALNAQSGAVWLYVNDEELVGKAETGRPMARTVGAWPKSLCPSKPLCGANSNAAAANVALCHRYTPASMSAAARALAAVRAVIWLRTTSNGAWSWRAATKAPQGKRALNSLHRALSHATGLQRFTQLAQSDDTDEN